jgi:excisionase family DNA binding protein
MNDIPSAIADEHAGQLLLGYSEVARRLGVSDRTARSLVYRGRLPSVRIGTRRLVAFTDLAAFLERLRMEGRA